MICGECGGDRTGKDVSSDGSHNRRVIRGQLEHRLNPYIISRHTPGDKEVQQVRYPAMVRRPVGQFTSAEVGTVVSTESREESASFDRDKTRAPSGMLRVPFASG
jgi:hypothetical protein